MSEYRNILTSVVGISDKFIATVDIFINVTFIKSPTKTLMSVIYLLGKYGISYIDMDRCVSEKVKRNSMIRLYCGYSSSLSSF